MSKNVLLALDKFFYGELFQRSISIKKNWYWEYYESIKNDIENKEERRKIYQQIYHLERFSYFNKKGFSSKGIEMLLKLKNRKEIKEKKWDKRWRIVIFDIPENKKKIRDSFRIKLKGLGFKKLQDSIWINAYGELNDVQNVVKRYGIAKNVVLIASDKISNDLYFMKKFNLT